MPVFRMVKMIMINGCDQEQERCFSSIMDFFLSGGLVKNEIKSLFDEMQCFIDEGVACSRMYSEFVQFY